MRALPLITEIPRAEPKNDITLDLELNFKIFKLLTQVVHQASSLIVSQLRVP